MRTIEQHADALAQGTTTARALVEEGLARIADPAGEGARAFIKVHADAARAMADAMDTLRRVGRAPSRYAGIPIGLKDLFDVAGEPTPAGSRALADAPPATAHAPVVQRMLAAGFVPMGRTNMTEFAFSGLGINPHYGTPRNPYDRASGGRIPGGSSSGAVISVTDGMAAAAIGSDTGGSIRIPAALCGTAGFKPTQRRVPTTGAFPLSHTMDSLGPIAPAVACCALIDSVLAGETPQPLASAQLSGLRLGVMQGYVLEALDPQVAKAFEAALAALSAAGAHLEDFHFGSLNRIPEANQKGTIPTYEGYDWHKDLIARHGDQYDPIVRSRMLRALDMTVTDYRNILDARKQIIAEAEPAFANFDAVLLPCVSRIAPRIADLEASLDAYLSSNADILRNPSIINFLDGCALSIPCHRPGEAPVGLMVAALDGEDEKVLRIGAAIETALAKAGCAIAGQN
jgi:aspartyl-tRNA(Asn)/glutamyl-tRNA(Gln) amidotransferase subunit A